MKQHFRVLLLVLYVLLVTQTLKSQEFLIREETFTWESAEDAYFGGNGFHWWSDYSTYPYNWISPYNYFEGKVYYRYEVIEQPTNKPFNLMFLIWQFQEDAQHRETGDDQVPISGGAGAVTEYNDAPPPSAWWSYYDDPDKKVDFTKIGKYSNTGDNRMGLALWSDGGCIPSSWGGSNPDFCNDRKPDYFPMKIRITIVAVAQGHTFSGWSNYGGGGGGDPDITFSTDYENERTNQSVPSYYEYSYNQTSWTTGSGNRLDLTPGQDVYFRKIGSTEVQTLDVPSRPSQPSASINFINETTNENIASTVEYSSHSDFSDASTGNGLKADINPGVDLYFRKASTGTSFHSNTFHLTVPDRPSTPNYSANYSTMETETPVSSGDEYSTNSDMSGAISGTNTTIPLTSGVDVYFRTKATATTFKSEVQHLEVLGIPDAPSYTIDFNNERTNTTVPSTVEYSEHSDMSGSQDGSGNYVDLTPGKDLYFRVKASGSVVASDIFHLDVPSRPAAPAAFSVNFITEKTNQNVSSTVEYATNSNFSGKQTGTNAVIPLTPGTDVYFRVKATSNAFHSDHIVLDVPARTTPDYGVDINTMKTDKAVSSNDEYSDNANMSGATSGANLPIDLTPGASKYFRSKATSTSFLSHIQKLDVPTTQPDAPSYAVDFINERTKTTVPATVEYSENISMTSPTNGTGTYVPLTPGKDLYFRVKANGSTPASEIFHLDVPSQPAAPAAFNIDFSKETTQENVSSAIQYSTNSNFSSASNGNGSPAPLQAGSTYYFRYKATATAFKSAATQLPIPTRPDAPVVTINFATETTTNIIPATVEYSTSSDFTSSNSGTGIKLPLTPGTDLYFRVKATSNKYKSLPTTLDVPGRNTPNYGIDFQNKQTNIVVANTDEYSEKADMQGALPGNNAKISITPGTDLYFRSKASSSAFISNIQRLDVPETPAGPSFAVDFAGQTTSTVVPNTVEYSTNANMNSVTTGAGVKIPVTPGTNLYFRKKATSIAFISEISTLSVPARPAKPTFTTDFVNEKTTENVDNTVEYATTSNFASSNTGNNTKLALTPGSALYLRKKSTTNSFTGEVQTLTTPARPEIVSDGGDTVTSKPFNVSITFPGTVTGFISTDITVSNASVISVSGSYKASIDPTAPGDVNLQIPANAVAEGNFASLPVKVYYKKLTGVNELTSNGLIRVYPNPSSDYMNIEIKSGKPEQYRLTIFNSMGKVVMTDAIRKSPEKVNIQHLPAGTYIVEIKDNQGPTTLKFIKE